MEKDNKLELTNISIFKNKDKQEGSQQPDFRLVASWKKEDGTYGNVTVASLWKGEKENGPALRGEMSKEYTNSEGKTFPAFVITRAEPKEEIKDEDVPW